MADYSKSLLELKTRPQVAVPHSPYSAQLMPTFCVVYHPDPAQLGARYVMSAHQQTALGRELEFIAVDGTPCFPLLDPYISRELGYCQYQARQLRIVRRTGASSIDYMGRPIGAEYTFDLDESKVYALNCSNRVVLSLALEEQLTGDSAPMVSIVGAHPKTIKLRRAIRRIASTDDDVLITGPTGVGKEGVATELHRFSKRRGQPMLAVNMAALPEDLAASELFGAEKGAYTGANSAKRGYFRQAAGGILFMDEIGDAPAELQAQLLRALQAREIQVLGGATQKVDVRVLAATEQSTQGEDSSLRPALMHRLSQQHINVPPLSQRLEDIGLLANYYFASKERGPWKSGQDDTAIAAWCQVFVDLIAYHWPGNVRELFAVLGQIDLDSDYPVVSNLGLIRGHEPVSELPVVSAGISDEAFLSALADCDYEVARLAQQLPISRPSIYRRRDRLGVPSVKDYTREQVLNSMVEHGNDVAKAAKALRVSVAALLRLYPELGE